MEIESIIKDSEKELYDKFKEIDDLVFENSKKVLDAFHKYHVSETHFNKTTGYGYNDIGRDVIEKIFADVLGADKALVRNQFVSGSHALNVAFFSYLRPGDTMLIITGMPYDTLHEVIGIKDNPSSLKSFGINYEIIDLIDGDFDEEKIIKTLSSKYYKLVHIQRSRGYDTRSSLVIEKLQKIIKIIQEISGESIICVDNCYCEMVETITPCQVGADVVVGSLIKNLGGGIAPNGAYIVGKQKYVALAGERLTLPGEGMDVGPSLGINESFLRGIYMAPSAVGSSLKLSILASHVLEKMGYEVSPRFNEKHADIVLMIKFNNEQKLVNFVKGIQAGSIIDAHAEPEPTDMPGYDDKIIMASGSFTQGSSIEISCDGPVKEPYVGYLQGSLTYEYAKLALIEALKRL